MKKLLSSSILTLSLAALTAQMNITLSLDTAYAYGDPSEIHKAEITVTNDGAEAQDMTWLRVKNDIPAEWQSSVCDPNLCWASFANSPGYGWNQPAGSEIGFYVQFDGRQAPDGPAIDGYGIVEVMIYSEDDSANYNAKAVFIGDMQGGTSIYSPSMDNTFEIYPNPAVNEITVMSSLNSGIKEIRIVNLVGKIVYLQNWQGTDGTMQVDLYDIPEGIYFVQFIGEKGVLSTKKLSITK